MANFIPRANGASQGNYFLPKHYPSKWERRLPSDEARTTRSITTEKITETGISKLTTSTYLSDAWNKAPISIKNAENNS